MNSILKALLYSLGIGLVVFLFALSIDKFIYSVSTSTGQIPFEGYTFNIEKYDKIDIPKGFNTLKSGIENDRLSIYVSCGNGNGAASITAKSNLKIPVGTDGVLMFKGTNEITNTVGTDCCSCVGSSRIGLITAISSAPLKDTPVSIEFHWSEGRAKVFYDGIYQYGLNLPEEDYIFSMNSNCGMQGYHAPSCLARSEIKDLSFTKVDCWDCDDKCDIDSDCDDNDDKTEDSCNDGFCVNKEKDDTLKKAIITSIFAFLLSFSIFMIARFAKK